MPEQQTQKNKETVHKDQNESLYNSEGVDLTLIRWMLSLSPTERLHHLQSSVNSLIVLRGSIRAKN
ncbi:hypothetical protein L6R29_25365 [Myxococcota bacterium]|nr:hypothetical protein [Myxococcota bacterium]